MQAFLYWGGNAISGNGSGITNQTFEFPFEWYPAPPGHLNSGANYIPCNGNYLSSSATQQGSVPGYTYTGAVFQYYNNNYTGIGTNFIIGAVTNGVLDTSTTNALLGATANNFVTNWTFASPIPAAVTGGTNQFQWYIFNTGGTTPGNIYNAQGKLLGHN